MTTDTLVEPHVADKIEPGAILYSSWGYDQTNIDFYYVVRCTEKSCWVVPMSAPEEPAPGFSPMAGYVTPGEPQWTTGFCECRHSVSVHQTALNATGDDYCPGFIDQDCDCTELRPVPRKPRMHRIRRWGDSGFERESITLTSYSIASLWEGGKLYASHYA